MRTNEFFVRVATNEDAQEISDVLAASYAKLMPAGYDAATLEAALPMMTKANAMLLASAQYYVAETKADEIIGCGGWTFERPGGGEIEDGLAHIRHFATHPNATGRGVGRALFEACEAAAREAGVSKFECYASLNAERFYAALGFKTARLIEVKLGGNVPFPSVVMTRKI